MVEKRFKNRAQYAGSSAERPMPTVRTASSLKVHQSESPVVSKTVSNVWVVLALDVWTGFRTSTMLHWVKKQLHKTTKHIHLLLLQPLRNMELRTQAGTEQAYQTEMSCYNEVCQANLDVPKIKNSMTGNDRVMSTSMLGVENTWLRLRCYKIHG